jgi:cyclophilin family peptidyl-prolyl cis-trans isomerase/HEAT repeat protein
VIRAGLTAVLRARPDGGEAAVKPFLAHSSPEVVADALNTLARLRSKTANPETRELLKSHKDPIVRANAARLLGAAEDKEALDLLINAAAKDADSRVRVSAIRSLAQLKDSKAATPLIERGNILLADYKRSKFEVPAEKNELLEIATALGLILANTEHEAAVKLLMEMLEADGGISPEIPIARLRVSQAPGDGGYPEVMSWRHLRTMVQVIGEVASIDPVSDIGKKRKAEAPAALAPLASAFGGSLTEGDKDMILAAPDVLTSYAKFKTEDLPEIARGYLVADDVFMRVAAANVLGNLPATKENVDALEKAFEKALTTDKDENDAQLAILDALFKLDKTKAVPALMTALKAPDYLVRKKAFDLLENKELAATPEIAKSLKDAREEGLDRVTQYRPATGTKLGQVLNTEADYRRAASRRNGNVKAVFTTEKGAFTIDLLPEDAPLTVDNFVKLANAKYFDGLEVHRVVPNFVMQDGDPLGNGSGGPGWSIRCEINMVPYTRGAVGMALSGKDTGGSQWFVTHSPQPHLDGGYTVFGRVNETDMKVVDSIVRGDKILTVKIIEGTR